MNPIPEVVKPIPPGKDMQEGGETFTPIPEEPMGIPEEPMPIDMPIPEELIPISIPEEPMPPIPIDIPIPEDPMDPELW